MDIGNKFWTRAKIIWTSIIAILLVGLGTVGYLYFNGTITLFAGTLNLTGAIVRPDKLRAVADGKDYIKLTITLPSQNPITTGYPSKYEPQVELQVRNLGGCTKSYYTGVWWEPENKGNDNFTRVDSNNNTAVFRLKSVKACNLADFNVRVLFYNVGFFGSTKTAVGGLTLPDKKTHL